MQATSALCVFFLEKMEQGEGVRWALDLLHGCCTCGEEAGEDSSTHPRTRYCLLEVAEPFLRTGKAEQSMVGGVGPGWGQKGTAPRWRGLARFAFGPVFCSARPHHLSRTTGAVLLCCGLVAEKNRVTSSAGLCPSPSCHSLTTLVPRAAPKGFEQSLARMRLKAGFVVLPFTSNSFSSSLPFLTVPQPQVTRIFLCDLAVRHCRSP